MFPRQIGLKRALCSNDLEWRSYIQRLNGKTSLYTSLYPFDETTRGRVEYDSAVMDCAWWDFDSNEKHDMDEVNLDVATLLRRLEGDTRLVFTGRGFHVYQPFAEPVRGREWAHRLDRYQREKAKGLESLDGVGYPEKLTRIPDTYNIKRGRWCVTVSPHTFLQDPAHFTPPTKPDPTVRHLRPFTGEGVGQPFSLIQWAHENPEKRIEKRKTQFIGVIGDFDSIPIPSCLNKAIRVSNPPHHVRVALVQVLACNMRMFAHPSDVPTERVDEIIGSIAGFIGGLGWLDYNPSITRRHIRSLMRYDRMPSQAWYRQHGLCLGNDCWFCGE